MDTLRRTTAWHRSSPRFPVSCKPFLAPFRGNSLITCSLQPTSAYTPNQDTGDYVIIINANKVKLTGDAEHKKNYYNVSGYNGGLRTRSSGTMLREYPVEMVERAVWGMLPKGPLGRKMYKKLFVYKDANHENEAQKPVKLELKK